MTLFASLLPHQLEQVTHTLTSVWIHLDVVLKISGKKPKKTLFVDVFEDTSPVSPVAEYNSVYSTHNYVAPIYTLLLPIIFNVALLQFFLNT